MNLANKSFRNNRTGEVIKVIDSFENIAVLENKQKIDTRSLMDINQWTEQIDPGSFFNNQGAYNILAEKIKNISTANMKDEDGTIPVSINSDMSMPTTNESAIVYSSEEDEKAELARKYGASVDNNALSRQQEAFAKLLGEESENNELQNIQVQNIPSQTKIENTQQPMVQNVRNQTIEDPIITMFKNVKRNQEFSISFEINNKIPRPDFIEMMEDSYEVSIIDFLADEFTNKILQDPSIIKSKIKNEITNIVYKKSEINSQITDSVTQKYDSLTNEKEPVLSKDLPKKVSGRKPKTKKETK